MNYSIATKIAKIIKSEGELDIFVVKATITLEDGRKFQAMGQCRNDTLSVTNTIEHAEDIAVDRAMKLMTDSVTNE